MIEDDQDQGDQGAVPDSDDLHPYIVYRNPEDDPIRCAFEEAARRLKAEASLSFQTSDEDVRLECS